MTKNRRFNSVKDLVRATVDDAQCADEFDVLSESRHLIRSLMALRAARKLSQSDIATKLNCSQSRISKLESGKDVDLSLGDLMQYAEAVGYDLSLAFVDTPNCR